MARARRGEVWLVDLGLVQKTRPCLILSIDYLDHERAVVTYIPRTTHLRQTRFEVPHRAPDSSRVPSMRKVSAAFRK